ncbi:XrtA/PEP-CTERM system TPR-repeat protein PrsT [Parahaliea aestuarii]|uniref:PEP-CTERM system TPR-repeat protein PrsT n=1 Tax=Parahaliea aestuarii TaxID=1852021 RepID=A0A5C8ZMJ0_9GAMM|nr:XrtA/PEP-CTERM system TPR-repeat protein PrsT [Parahaliea aestuarii]TXS89668.1 PEP-CTERM system TPR-repeat protein PrsT [Parahaliea aestuarii]
MKDFSHGFWLACLFLVAVLQGCSESASDADYLARAESAVAEGDNPEAIIHLKNALQQNGSNWDARYLLGKLYFETGDLLSAEKELERVQSSSPEGRDELLSMLARSWEQLGRSDELLDLEVQGLSDSERATVITAKALVYTNQGEVERAAVLLGQAAQLTPDSPYLLYAKARNQAASGDLDAASETLGPLLDSEAADARAWSLGAALANSAGQQERALESYSKAVELAPRNLEYRLQRALTYIQIRDFDAAEDDIDWLLKHVPQSTAVNYALGLLRVNQGQYEAANSALLIAEADKFRLPNTLLLLAMANLQLGDQDKAYRYAQEFYALVPENPSGQRLIASLWVRHGKAAEAEALARELLESNPNDVEVMNTLANSLVAQQRADEAIGILSRVAEMRPDSASARVRLGAGFASTGRDAEAEQLVNEAIALDPESSSGDTLLVATRLKEGDVDGALVAAREYQARNPKEAYGNVLIGQVLLADDKRDQARDEFQRAIELDPGYPAARHQLAALAFADGDIDTARNHYLEVLKVHENALGTLLALAALEGVSNNQEQMLVYLERAIAAHPDRPQPRIILARTYLATGQPEKVAVAFTGLSAEAAGSPVVRRLNARALLELKQYSEAVAQMQPWLQSGNGSAADHRLMARAYEGMGDLPQMQVQLERVVELEPDEPGARISLGRYALETEQLALLEQQIEALQRIAPDDARTQLMLAGKAKLEGDQQAALDILQALFEKQPGTYSVLNLQRQYEALGQTASAIDLLESWVQEREDDIPARLTLAAKYLANGRESEAVKEYTRIIEQDPDNVIALNNLAWMLKDSETARALAYIEHASKASNAAPAVQDTLAMVLSASGDHDQARRIIRELVRSHPDNPEFLYHGAVIANAAQAQGEAAENLRQLLESYPDFAERDAAEALLRDIDAAP